jgi:hypothetical protein
MKKYKVLILVMLPAFLTLVYLSFSETKGSNERFACPNLNSRITGMEDYLRYENQKLIPKSELFISCQFIIPGAGNQSKGNTSGIFCGVSIQDGNLTIGSRVIQEEISISKAVSAKRRNMNFFSRIEVRKDSSLNCKFHFSF